MALAKSGKINSQVFQGVTVDVLLPNRRTVASEIPDRAKRYLDQAISSLAAPDGAAMLAGSAVDAMLKGRGFEKGTHYQRIEEAVKSGLLTKEMGEWAHAVRLGSNNPRHADDDAPHMTSEETVLLIEFATMLGHILYVLPSEVAKGKEKASAATPTEAISLASGAHFGHL